MADFVINEKIGIVVNNLEEIEYKINNLSNEEYRNMLSNINKISQNLKDGYYIKKAVQESIK